MIFFFIKGWQNKKEKRIVYIFHTNHKAMEQMKLRSEVDSIL